MPKMRPFTPGTILLLAVAAVRAQTPAPAFEVASVKPNKSADFRRLEMQFLPGGRFSATNIPLFMLIGTAYNIPVFNESIRLSGSPDWIRSERFDIEATPGQSAIPNGLTGQARNARVRLMLQTLLAERFKLVMRRESKELPVYAIGVGKNGPNLVKSKIEENDCPESKVACHQLGGGQGRGLHGQAIDMSDVAVFVENYTDHPVVDRTGLKGLYEINTDGWVPLIGHPGPAGETEESRAMADPARPTLYMIFDKLGLKMELKKAPVDIYVIEHVERPTDN